MSVEPKNGRGLSFADSKHADGRIQQQVKPVLDEDDLTSCYDEEKKNFFREFNLFYVLLYNGFAAFLPFLSIYLYTFGFNFTQIGVLNGLSYLVSGFMGPIWSCLTKQFDNRKTIMLISLVTWVLFFLPIIFLPSDRSHALCPNNDTNTRRKHDNIPASSSYSLYLICGLLLCGRVFQSATDYFYSYHSYLINTNEELTNLIGPQDFNLTWKLLSVFICTVSGYFLDTIQECSIKFGRFKISYYCFVGFISFAFVVLNFLEVPPYRVLHQRKRNSRENNVFGWAAILLCLFTIAVTHSVRISFLYLHVYTINGLFTQIGLAYFVYQCSMSTLEYFAPNIQKQFGIFEVLFLNLCTNAISCLYFSYSENRLDAWFIIAFESLSGLHVLLPQSVARWDELIMPSFISFETQYFIIYWIIGFPIGTIGFGVLTDQWTVVNSFRFLAALNMFFCSIAVILYCTNKITEKDVKELTEPLDPKDESEDDLKFLEKTFE